MRLLETIYSDEIPSSFVKKPLKFYSDTGNGEAKLYLNDNYTARQYINFFNGYANSNRYFFDRDSLLNYLNNPVIENYFYSNPTTRTYKSIDGYLHSQMLTIISNYPSRLIPLSFEPRLDCDDQYRYYIRSYDNIFREYLRSIALPRTAYLRIDHCIAEDNDAFGVPTDTNVYFLYLEIS